MFMETIYGKFCYEVHLMKTEIKYKHRVKFLTMNYFLFVGVLLQLQSYNFAEQVSNFICTEGLNIFNLRINAQLAWTSSVMTTLEQHCRSEIRNMYDMFVL